MPQRHPSSKRAHFLILAAIIGLSATIFGCRDQTPAATPPVSADTHAPATARSKEQAMSALMALPELKAWSSHLEKSSGGKVHGALIEYDPQPKLLNGKSYWQFSFVDNGSDAAHRWESFLVANSDDEILVEDLDTDAALTLQQWRQEKHPLRRTAPE
jgi:hypothetical protein